MFKQANLTVMVSDMKRAARFYGEVLGFKLGQSYGGEWQDVEAPGLRIGLHPGGKKPLKEHSRHFAVGLRVDDLDAAMKALVAKGVEFGETPSDRGSRLAYFNDPDGNPFYL